MLIAGWKILLGEERVEDPEGGAGMISVVEEWNTAEEVLPDETFDAARYASRLPPLRFSHWRHTAN